MQGVCKYSVSIVENVLIYCCRVHCFNKSIIFFCVHCFRFAFVDFKSEEALKTAFARKGNLELRGHRLLLDNSREKVSHRKTDASE